MFSITQTLCHQHSISISQNWLENNCSPTLYMENVSSRSFSRWTFMRSLKRTWSLLHTHIETLQIHTESTVVINTYKYNNLPLWRAALSRWR